MLCALAALGGPLQGGAQRALPAAYLALAGTLLLLFPVTGGAPALTIGVVGVLLALLLPGAAPTPRVLGLALPLLGALLGGVFGWAQRAPGASTHPAPLPATPLATTPSPDVQLTSGPMHLAMAPELDFISVSPDRFWTVFHPWSPEQPPCATETRPRPDGVDVETVCELAEPVYSHLNGWAGLQIAGHQSLSVGFEALPGVRQPVRPLEGEHGSPYAFAFVRDDALHLAQARRREKGPFELLASGPLPPDGTVAIVLYDADAPRFRLELLDFARQASTEPSPSAGWGVPQNSIEFRTLGVRPEDPAAIWISLAATSVGRGFDSVGYAAGRYRNRIRVTALE